MNPLVSIVCVTYNHESYLRQALDSFLMQKTSFAYEIVLAEDCSTDGTRKICEEYTKKHPDIIHYIYRDYNIGGIANEYEALSAARGKYIALCEGDDYWTDPLKLQRQVDFLECHPNYSMCFHRARVDTANKKENDLYSHLEEREYSAYEIYKDWVVPTCSVMYRAEMLPPERVDGSVIYSDIYMYLKLAEKGRVYNLNFEGAVYRRNSGGISQNGNVSLYKRLYQQYIYMEKYFPQSDLVKVSRDMQELYLKSIIASDYFPERWKYRVRYMMRHPKLICSKFGLVTIWQIFCKPHD